MTKAPENLGEVRLAPPRPQISEHYEMLEYRRADLPPKVNPLVWVKSDLFNRFLAKTEVGNFIIQKETDLDGKNPNWVFAEHGCVISTHETETGAKAGAQIEFEKRIHNYLEKEV